MLTLPRLRNCKKIRTLAVLTSGGDAPGMNAAIRAVTRFALSRGVSVFGILKGYSGLLEGQFEALSASSVANILQRGGTILKTDRCEAFYRKDARREAANLLARKGIDALVVIGGDGSFRGAHALEAETGLPTAGVPGTIDNDIPGSEDTIGFDTAVNTALESIDRIRDTANSHDRLFIVEVMGRSSGFIALQVGIGGGAESVFVPELKQRSSEVLRSIERGIKRGKTSSIIIVAEGPRPGLSQKLAHDLKRCGYTPRVCILGHTQRGGAPTAHDRFLASVLGASAVAELLAGRSGAYAGVQDGKTAWIPYREVVGARKPLPKGLLELAQALAI